MKNNGSILNKELSIPFAFLMIFVVGLIIVFSMVSYINAKVTDFTDGYTINSNN